ncbi:hypothetical protein GCM10010156_47200 [Planobispora rosea]|uniref:WD40 repeat domain-containing protein n=1 Tax=Planobispora rosea TaxID=35762 RepID=A0A8J3RZJ5_PLARO|nr:hypothetical protein [Planobispora rosea]GGS83086.1 hypothetical protein GCM10010156_47200 [Planobispora rosea]GIH84165.1 hypothetical protein Pro02_25730 [Planobispora rosea]
MRSDLHSGRTLVATLATALATVLPAGAAHAAPRPTPVPAAPWVKEFSIPSNEITESSGLYASRLHPGVFWTHNDGPGEPVIYAVNEKGITEAAIRLEGATAIDTEAIGGFVDSRGNAMLFLADIGDNEKTRVKGVTIFALPEPSSLSSTKAKAESYQLVYPDGPHDAEALLVHPQTGNLYIVTKSPSGGAVYAAPTALVPGVTNRMEHIAPVPHVISDGVLNAGGQMFLRGYNKVRVFSDITGKLLETIPAPKQPQGESLTIGADGRSLFAGSEGAKSAVFRLPLPEELAAAPVRVPSPPPEVPAGQPDGETSTAYPSEWLWVGGLLAGAVVIAALAPLARRRRARLASSAESDSTVALVSQREN